MSDPAVQGGPIVNTTRLGLTDGSGPRPHGVAGSASTPLSL
jgi:hypothetical protein